MTFDETRDNTIAIEAQIIEADARAREESAPYPPAYPFPVFGAKIVPLIVTVDELPPVPRVPFNPPRQVVEFANADDPQDPEHDEIGDADTEYDIEFDESVLPNAAL